MVSWIDSRETTGESWPLRTPRKEGGDAQSAMEMSALDPRM